MSDHTPKTKYRNILIHTNIRTISGTVCLHKFTVLTCNIPSIKGTCNVLLGKRVNFDGQNKSQTYTEYQSVCLSFVRQ